MTEIQITPKWSDVKPCDGYVYIHYEADTGRPFYIGRGVGRRAWNRNRSTFWNSVASKHGVVVDVVIDGLTKHEANQIERILIRAYRDAGHRLVNLTNGGDGRIDMPPSNVRPVCNNLGMRFPSIAEAVLWLHETGAPLARDTNIISVCKGENHMAHGFSWWYDGDEPKEYMTKGERSSARLSRPVISSNGEEFPSQVAAARWLRENGYPKASPGSIAACVSGIQIVAYGRKWFDVSTPAAREILYTDPNDGVIGRKDQPSLFAEHHS